MSYNYSLSLYYICAERLSVRINSTPEITDLTVLGQEPRIIQYEDDICIFLDGSGFSLQELFNIFHDLSGPFVLSLHST